jgi:hypothetical protein
MDHFFGSNAYMNEEDLTEFIQIDQNNDLDIDVDVSLKCSSL